MKTIKFLAYRYLTDAEYFNIYKPSGTEDKGGGQVYIDFPTDAVGVKDWDKFFKDVPGVTLTKRANGPAWESLIHSIGPITASRKVLLYQRRSSSVCVASQRISSRSDNRVDAWRPENGFPEPRGAVNRNASPKGLAVFLIRTEDNEIWAGWFQGGSPMKDAGKSAYISEMLESPEQGKCGIIIPPSGALLFDPYDASKPFFTSGRIATKPVSRKEVTKKAIVKKVAKKRARKQRSEEEILDSLFADDESETISAELKEKTIKVKKRNKKAAEGLKSLYKGKCQFTGYTYTFKKPNGDYYSEAHHLIPLGQEGADSPFNIVVISPLIHRMLHYADVSEIDMSKMVDNKLEVTINDQTYTVTWHPKHAESVLNKI